MDYASIHSTLYDWSTAENSVELVNKVLKDGEGNTLNYNEKSINNEIVERVSKKIQEFLKDNMEQFAKMDVPALKELKTVVKCLKYLSEDIELETTVAEAILLAKKNKTDLTKSLREDLRSIVGDYAMDGLINLTCFEQAPPTKSVEQSIKLARQEDMQSFAKELIARHATNPNVFKKMVKSFFRSASLEDQERLLLSIRYTRNTIPPFDLIRDLLIALPRDANHLNFSFDFESFPYDLRGLIAKILIKSKNLQSLKLRISFPRRYIRIENKDLELGDLLTLNIPTLKKICLRGCRGTEKFFIDICNNPDLINLSCLNLDAENLDELVDGFNTMWEICNSKYLILEELNLSNYILDKEGLIELAHSPHRDKLQNLGLSHCELDDANIKIIINESNFKFISFNLSNNPNLTDHTVDGLIDCLTSDAIKCSYKTTLQYVNLNGCPRISEEAKVRLEEILQRNRN